MTVIIRDKTNRAAGDNIFNDVLADIVESMAATEFVVTTLHRVHNATTFTPSFGRRYLGRRTFVFLA